MKEKHTSAAKAVIRLRPNGTAKPRPSRLVPRLNLKSKNLKSPYNGPTISSRRPDALTTTIS